MMTLDEQFNTRRATLRENIPLEVQQLVQWTPTFPASSLDSAKAKRPFISTKEHDKLLTLQGAIDFTQDWSTLCYYGIVSIGTSSLSIIDVDDFYQPDSDNVSPLVSPGAKIIIEDLAAQTYTETSLSGKGLHIFLNIIDKPQDKGYIKAQRGWSGQLSLHNNFMVCTGNKLPTSPTTILTVSMDDLVALIRMPTRQSGLPPALTSGDSQEPRDLTTMLAEYIENGTALSGQGSEATAWEEIRQDLACLTLDRNPRVIRAWETVTQTTYEHYDFWLRIGMAIHFETQRLGSEATGMRLFVEWSATDPTSYTGEQDVINKWASFGKDLEENPDAATRVTYRTIKSMVRQLVIDWPDYDSKGQPDKSSIRNMMTLLSYYSLRAYEWPGFGMLVDGDPDIVKQFFTNSREAISHYASEGIPVDRSTGLVLGLGGPVKKDNLDLNLANLAQRKAQWKGAHKSYSGDMARLFSEPPFCTRLNPTNRWLSTPPEQLPDCLKDEDNVLNPRIRESSTFETFMKAFRFPDDPSLNVNLITRMLKAMLMQIVRFADPTAQNEHSEGMVILVGPEGCRKTSFFEWLYPPSFRALVKVWMENVTSDKNIRDIGRALSGAGIFLMDECDSVLKGGEIASWLKKILTQNVVRYTEIYATSEKIFPRTALICGTTNNRDIWLSSSDNRRMWLIDVEYIDIEFLNENVSRYWLYRNMFTEFSAARAKGERPWLMDPKDFLSIRLTNETMSAKSSLQMDLEDRMVLNLNGPVRTQPMSIAELEELVGNPQRPDHKNLYTTQQIKRLMKLSGEYVPNTAQLKHALKRISENWTGHRKPVKICPRNVEYVYKEGEVWYKDRRAWLLPAWRQNEED